MNTAQFFYSLFSTNLTTQNEALDYFSALSLSDKQTVTAEFEEVIEGNTHRFQRPEKYLPDLEKAMKNVPHWLMLATAQDPRWINACHLHQTRSRRRIFLRLIQELFAHLLLHPNLQTLDLMNMPTDGMELLELLRSQGGEDHWRVSVALLTWQTWTPSLPSTYSYKFVTLRTLY